ncbi:hypothetical protein IFM89_030660, partial [Coptis chinensis]
IWVFSDDERSEKSKRSERSERSEQGLGTGFRKPPQPQLVQKSSGGLDLHSPDGNSRDNSVPDGMMRAKQLYYGEQMVQVQSRDNWNQEQKREMNNQNYRVQMQQQLQDSSYGLTKMGEKELENQLMEAGTKLLEPPSSVEELLSLLDILKPHDGQPVYAANFLTATNCPNHINLVTAVGSCVEIGVPMLILFIAFSQVAPTISIDLAP